MLRRKRTPEQPSAQVEEPSAADVQLPSAKKYKKLLIVAVAFVVVLAGAAAAYFITRDQAPTDTVSTSHDARDGVNTSSDPEDLKDPLTKLNENIPAETASSKEKAAYYRQLAQIQADQSEYEAAIQTYTTEEKEAGASMIYQDYYEWAYYYERVGNNSAAIEKLQKVLEMLPEKEPSTPNYSKQKIVNLINERIERLSA